MGVKFKISSTATSATYIRVHDNNGLGDQYHEFAPNDGSIWEPNVQPNSFGSKNGDVNIAVARNDRRNTYKLKYDGNVAEGDTFAITDGDVPPASQKTDEVQESD